MEIRCPDCHIVVKKSYCFCPKCGHEFKDVPYINYKSHQTDTSCPRCSRKRVQNYPYCPRCGYEFGGTVRKKAFVATYPTHSDCKWFKKVSPSTGICTNPLKDGLMYYYRKPACKRNYEAKDENNK